jgi:hypothetical protein
MNASDKEGVIGSTARCPSENEEYVGELLNWRVQKLATKK